MLKLQVFFINYWCDKWLLVSKKMMWVVCPYVNQYEFATKIGCKNVVKKFVSITLLLKESMIFFFFLQDKICTLT